MKSLLEQCKHQQPPDPNYFTWDDLWYWKRRLLIPRTSNLVQQILREFHSSLIGGHSSIARTLARISTYFKWHGMKDDVKKFVIECSICQQAKSANIILARLLQPLPIPNQIWEDIVMDFITGLRISHDYSVVFMVIDRLSKYTHFYPLRIDYDSKTIAQLFLQ